MFIGIGQAQVVLILKLILGRIGRGIAAGPEVLDKMFALLLVGELPEGLFFFLADNVDNLALQPVFIGAADLMLQGLGILLFLLLAERTLQRISLIRLAGNLLLTGALHFVLAGALRLRIPVRRLRPERGCEHKHTQSKGGKAVQNALARHGSSSQENISN